MAAFSDTCVRHFSMVVGGKKRDLIKKELFSFPYFQFPLIMASTRPPFIELSDLYLNLDQVAFVRKEEHTHLGMVVAIHFAGAGLEPLYIGERHYEELRSLLGTQEVASENPV